jgi:diaminohydroxyphosphoribosylaminopyrimidine deaminase/5-amino-6-(5-phosphoribosylamino)uracil reductase
MNEDVFMHRCFDLAKKGGKATKKNPQVGAILVYDNKIIGEGYHQEYGGPHAEVNCLKSVKEHDRALIPSSTLFVSLEPCCIYGKTPPCTDLILKSNIKKVVISTLDINPKVHGKGVSILRANGVTVSTGVLSLKGEQIIKIFRVNHLEKRPYILLKVVKSKDNFTGRIGEKIWLSNWISNIYTHRLRSKYDGIIAGSRTIVNDNPSLTTRNFPGPSPTRITIDRNATIPNHLKFFSPKGPAIYFTSNKRDLPRNIDQLIIADGTTTFLDKVVHDLFKKGIYSIIVEGGSRLISQFIKLNLWDEALVITTPIILKEGLHAENITGKLWKELNFGEDKVHHILNENQTTKHKM